MVEGTARLRASRAVRTRTLPVGEREDYKLGEQVDFYRPPSSKHVSGWSGPSRIIDVSNLARGTVTIRHRCDMPIEVRLQDLRRHLSFLVFLSAPHAACTLAGSGWDLIRKTIENLAKRQSIHLGWIWTPNGWRLAKAMDRHSQVFGSMVYFATAKLHLENISGVCLGKGCATIGKIRGYQNAYLFWWISQQDVNQSHLQAEQEEMPIISGVNFRLLVPDHWQQVRYAMFLQSRERLDAVNPTEVATDQPETEVEEPRSEQLGVGERLSTIPEENTDDLESLFIHDDAELYYALRQALLTCPDLVKYEEDDECLLDAVEQNGDKHHENDDPLYWCDGTLSTAAMFEECDSVVEYHHVAAGLEKVEEEIMWSCTSPRTRQSLRTEGKIPNN